MNTVSLCMIVKNEEHNIGALLDDVCPVLEEVILVDTGSTDRTLEILAEKQKLYPNLVVDHFEWVEHFSKARNFSFAKATQEWVFWVDGDDRVDQQRLLHFKNNVLDNNEVDVWILPYIYSKNIDGSPSLTLGRERFLRRSTTPTWEGAIHESIGIWHLRQAEYNELAIDHNRAGKVIDFSRNLRILESEYEREPNNPRTAYYTAKERFDSMKPNAKEALEHYLTLAGRFYDDEIGARFRLAKTYLAEKRHGDAIKVIDPVYHLDGTRKRSEYYFIYGEVEYDLRNFEIAIDWYERCVKTPPPPPRVLNLEYWTWHPLKKIAMCYDELGNWAKAAEYAKKALDKVVGDEEMLKWAKGLTNKKLDPRPGHRLVTMEIKTDLRHDSYQYGRDFGEIDFNNMPFADASFDGVVVDFRELTTKQTERIHEELARVVKPGGFLWSVGEPIVPRFCEKVGPDDFQLVAEGKYLKAQHQVYSYYRTDFSKPTIAYAIGDENFGPYRYRVSQLARSAKKSGYPTVPVYGAVPNEAYVFVSLNLANYHKNDSVLYVLEVCEELGNYSVYGIENADVVNASSRKLASHIQGLYPDKKVINVDDHFELPAAGWL